MVQTRKCKCGGEVETCQFCFGRGEVIVGEPSYFPVRKPQRNKALNVEALIEKFGSPTTREQMKVALAARNQVCDRCNFHGTPEALRRHRDEKHPSAEVLKQRRLAKTAAARERDAARSRLRKSSKPSKPQDSLAQRRARQAERHRRWQVAVEERKQLIEKTISEASKSEPVSRPPAAKPISHVSSSPASMTLRQALIAKGIIKAAPKATVKIDAVDHAPNGNRQVLCPLCQKPVAKVGDKVRRKLTKHLDGKHPLNQPPAPKEFVRPPHSVADRGPKFFEQDRKVQRQAVWQPHDPLDANRGMGAFARDNGRFGSHALHDRFDDEGMP